MTSHPEPLEDAVVQRFMESAELRTRYFGLDPFRPRDEFDVDVHPESVRGRALALMDKAAAAHAEIIAAVEAMPWYRRWPIRLYARLRGVTL
jgi:hypothetical protein